MKKVSGFNLRSHKPQRKLRQCAAATALLAAALVGISCEEDADIAAGIAELTESCALNSDCDPDLVCVFERCHNPCRSSEDCAYPARCVQSDKTKVFACLFPDDAECAADRQTDSCNSPLQCASDNQCRGPCKRDKDCPGDQLCSTEGACAEDNEVDSSGALTGASPSESTPDAGDTPAPPENEDASTSQAPDDSSKPDAQSPMGDSEEPKADSGAKPQPKPDASEAEPEPEFAFAEPDGGEEPVANNTREEAQPLTTASIWLSENDSDWFYVDVPNDGHTHIIEIIQTQGAQLASTLTAYAGPDSDFSEIGSSVGPLFGAGVSRTAYVTVGPGTRTLLEFSVGRRSANDRSDIRVNVLSEDDPHEPNDSRKSPATISTDTDISAQMLSAYVSRADRSNQDWYAVQLRAGEATFELLSTPDNIRYTVEISPDGPGPTRRVGSTTTPGATDLWSVSVPEDGTYLFSIRDIYIREFFVEPADHLFTQYVFRISQPPPETN